MALKKKKRLDNGTEVSYHKIRTIEIRPYEKEETVITKDVTEAERRANPSARPIYETRLESGYEMLVVVDSYADQETRKKGVAFAIESTRKSQVFPKENFDSANIFQQAYALVKSETDFFDAEDC